MKRLILYLLLFLSSQIILAQKNLSFRDTVKYPLILSNIWGYADSTGKEYAIVGVYDGVSIVDVTNPDSIYQLFFITGPNSYWRELRTWNKHVYVTNESSNGLLIIDLSNLPSSVSSTNYTGGGLNKAHALHIDENGFAYIYGNNMAQGALILDLADPKNPLQVGTYSTNYIHDGFVRGDTLWAGEIYNGWVSVINVSDKSLPVVMATQSTPYAFTHNTWLSDNGKYLFTTDEKSNAYVTSYDVSNLSNIKELDRYRSNHSSGSIPHNTYFLNDFLHTSYYRDGITIVDAARPVNLIEVGHYDTSPLSGSGFEGCWGVYPYLPSGNILATDRQEGLFILTPKYVRGCYMEGVVTDTFSGSLLQGVSVIILPDSIIKLTDIIGEYKTGISDSGFYDIKFDKTGYYPRTITGIELTNGQLVTLNTNLIPDTLDTLCNVVAFFTATDSIFCVGSTVSFNNSSINANLYQWLENDVHVSFSANLNKIFTDTGSYKITLIADKGICQDTLSRLINIKPLPVSDFSHNISVDTVSFANSSVGAIKYSWNFGDGFTDTAFSPVHIFSDSGGYNVCLIASNGFCSDTTCKLISVNCTIPIANFSFIDSALSLNFIDSSVNAQSYLWNFDDGYTDSVANPTHTFSVGGVYYNICLTVSNFCGVDSMCKVFTCNLPVSGFSYTVDDTIDPKLFYFQEVSMFTDHLLWLFGDSKSDTNSDVYHLYDSVGSYNVCLVVFNECGIDTLCKTITITGTGIFETTLSNNIKIYPNPSNGKLFIDFQNQINEKLEVRIFNVLGEVFYSKVIYDTNNQNFKIDISKDYHGVYFLNLQTDKFSVTEKIILLK